MRAGAIGSREIFECSTFQTGWAKMNDCLSPHVLIIALTFLLAGIVKGVTEMGLATVAVGILGAIMPLVVGLLLLPETKDRDITK